MNNFFTHLFRHPHYKLLALLAAMGMWLYVQGTEVSERAYQLPVDWKYPEQLTPTQPLPQSIRVTLTGSRNALRSTTDGSMRIAIDLSEIFTEPGEQMVRFENYPVMNQPKNITVGRTNPTELNVELDEVGFRNFAVEAVPIGDPASGYMVEEIHFDSEVVELRGPKTQLAEIRNVKTLPIDVSGLRHDKRVQVSLDIPRGVEVVSIHPMDARIDVEPRVAGRAIDGVPIFVKSSRNWVVQPSTVRVRLEGPTAALQKVRDEEVLAVVIVPDDATRGSYEVSFGESGPLRAKIVLNSDSVQAVLVDPPFIKVVRR